jgi:hypothetical protein
MSGPYDNVTIPDVFAWLDTLRGWDIATHMEYESLRDIALEQHSALAKQLAEARNDGLDLRRYATELEIALGQVSPLAKHIITDIRNECRITSEFMGENITGDLPDTEENTPCGETSS